VVILDEVDQLEDPSLLYDLYRIRELTMILIANREEDVFGRLDERLNSRLSSCARIRFGQYGFSEIITILEDRIRWGLREDAITQAAIEQIADQAAGDARKAIGILRNAAKTAKYSDEDKITSAVITRAVPEAKSELQRKTVEKLTKHQQVLYEIIKEDGEIEPSVLYDRYCEQVADDKSKRMVRNYLSKLEHYNLIESEGKTKGRIYRLPVSTV
jgi:Cdc6-like AAA superfamily ATPase